MEIDAQMRPMRMIETSRMAKSSVTQGMTTGDLAEGIAGWALDVSFPDAASATRERLSLLLIDSLACALAGRGHAAVRSAREMSLVYGERGDGAVIGSRDRIPLLASVLVNGAQIRALDWNDIYWGKRQGGHPSDILAAALSVGAASKASGSEFLSSLLAGYEIYCRIADQIDPDGAVDHTTQGIVASAAVAARLLRLDVRTTANALRIAASTGVHGAVWRKGKIASGKAIVAALAAQNGVMAAYLARTGVEGPPGAVESRFGLAGFLAPSADCSELLPRPGEPYKVDAVAAKLYPCVGAAQAAISAGIGLHRSLSGRVADIASVRIAMRDIPVMRNLVKVEYRRPANSETADHSLYFLVAVSLLDGAIGTDTFSRRRWLDADVVALMDKLTISAHLKGEDAQGTFPASIEVALNDGAIVMASQSRSLGDPGAGNFRSHIIDKLRSVGGGVGAAQVEEIVQAIDGLEEVADAQAIFAPCVCEPSPC